MSDRQGGPGRSSYDHPDNRGVWVETWVIDVVEGDLPAALLLSQILYWHQPGKSGKPKLRFERGGFLWLTRSDDDWWAECRLTLRQVRRIRRDLRRLNLIEHRVVRRPDGTTVSAWRPNLEAIQEVIDIDAHQPGDDPGVTSRGHSEEDPGVTSRGHSGVTSRGQSHGSDVTRSVPSDATTPVPSSLLGDEKDRGKTVAPPEASPPVPTERRIVDAWWEEQKESTGHKPVESYMGVVQIVKRCLASDWSEAEVAEALREVPCVTIPAMTRHLRGRQRQRSVGDDNIATAVSWLQGEPGGK